MFLSKSTFRTVIESTPLVSIDLVVKNSLGQVLLGKRVNRPAQGFWFVPGGRILKDELIPDAFKRLTQLELGQAINISDASFVGVYQHLYDDSAVEESITTHYVVLAYEVTLSDTSSLPVEQHTDYRWLEPEVILNDDSVHENSQAYFIQDGALNFSV